MFNHSKSIFWFRRDLRLEDNHGLYLALKESQQIYCIFIFDTNILSKLQDKDDKRVCFIWESLKELRKQLIDLGHELFIFYGDPKELIPQIAKKTDAEAVYTNRDYESYPLKRDEIVHAKLSKLNKHFVTTKDHIVFESTQVTKADGKPYTVFTPYKRTWLKKLDEDWGRNLQKYNSLGLLKESLTHGIRELDELKTSFNNSNLKIVEDLKDIGFAPSPLIVEPGTKAANEKLDSFLQNRIVRYKADRDLPWKSGTSDLSVHLRFGTVSIRECFRKAYEYLEIIKAKSSDTDSRKEAEEGINTWISELIWREFYSMVLQAFPHVENNSFKAEYQNLVWRVNDKLLTAWMDGMTGYPIVDAGMRQLRTTGQMHNRVRMIVASFLTKDLLIDWQKGEAHFARFLLDYELASNNGGWQWSASTGTDAVPYFRIFNPQLQGERFDPEAEYIKKYVPELKMLAAKKIHKLDFKVNGYPSPIVRREETKQAVMNLFQAAQKRIDLN